MTAISKVMAELTEARAENRRLRRELKAKNAALEEGWATLTNVWSDGEPEFRSYYSEIPAVLKQMRAALSPRPRTTNHKPLSDAKLKALLDEGLELGRAYDRKRRGLPEPEVEGMLKFIADGEYLHVDPGPDGMGREMPLADYLRKRFITSDPAAPSGEAKCVGCGHAPHVDFCPPVPGREPCDCIVRAPTPEAAASCTGTLVHDEFTYCPVHDRKK